ncbi:sporulation protein SsgA, partial [Streptomyces sp. CSDS2]|nr:sporulation protein SsgA [Streptomyces sp. CSDS2]
LLTGEGGGGSVRGYLLHRVKPHLPPWLAVGATGVAGALGHWRGADSAAAGVGLTLSSVILDGGPWWAGRAAPQQRRRQAAITVAAG